MTDAVVVGSGPNGLAAAITLAQAGLSVEVFEASSTPGGGARTAELTLPGLKHDVCSAVHPFAVASPFLATLPLHEHGLDWVHPEVLLAHPLDGGRAGLLRRSLDDTAAGLGVDGRAWTRLFGPLARSFDAIAAEVLQPIVHVPAHPVPLVRFGLRALPPMSLLARLFDGEEAPALLAGSAAHLFAPLTRPLSSAVGVMLTASAHAVGWPVAVGGTGALSAALVAVLRSLGGVVHCDTPVRSLTDLPPARVRVFDTAPSTFAAIAGPALPAAAARRYTRFRHGPAAFKLDLAVESGVPWAAPGAAAAGTVHLGGSVAELVATERDVFAGRMPDRPFVLVGQQSVCDPSRAVGDVHPIWSYAHVPAGYTGDASEAILAQFERFAPGLRERIVGSHVMSPAALESYNANYVGGDIASGANTLRQLLARPRGLVAPYRTGLAGHYLCSASTPPGAGTHGMCGHNAARLALADLQRG